MHTKNPFKPIKNKTTEDPFFDYMNSEMEKSEKTMEEILSDQSKLDEDYKPIYKEKEDVKINLMPYKVSINSDDIFITQERWSKMIATLYLDVFNTEKSFLDVSSAITDSMSKNGVNVNIDDMKRRLETISDRMVLIYSAKNIALSMGLNSEWDSILEKELEIIYGSKEPLTNKKV